MKRRKNIKSLALTMVLILLLGILSGCTSSDTDEDINKNTENSYLLTVKDATSDFYINDFAGIFTEQQKAEMMEKAVNMDNDYSGIQVVVTTVDSFSDVVTETKGGESGDNFTIEEVSYSMFTQYGIGRDDMGILVLFSVGDREVKIETGRKMQIYITDATSGKILDDYGMEYFVNDKFSEGLISVQSGVISEIEKRVPKNWSEDLDSTSFLPEDKLEDVKSDAPEVSTNVTSKSSRENENDSTGFVAGVLIGIAAFLAAIVVLIRNLFNGKKKLEILEKKKVDDLAAQEKMFDEKISGLKAEHRNEIYNIQSELDRKDAKIQSLNTQISLINAEREVLADEMNTLKDKYSRIQKLHPEFDFESEVYEMIEGEYKEAALKVEAEMAHAFETSADKDNSSVFKNAILLYEKADAEVKKYITSDMSKMEALYLESVALKEEYERAEQEKRDRAAASKAYDEISKVYAENPKGNYMTYESLHAAYRKYENLTSAQRGFFPDSELILSLEREIRRAREDKKNFDAAKNAESKVSAIINSIYSVDENDRDELEIAMDCYRKLSDVQQKYFSDELLTKLKRLISEAEEDHERNERRRRQQRMSSSTPYRSSSSYSSGFGGSSSSSRTSSSSRPTYRGRGGRPSSGGAKRKF